MFKELVRIGCSFPACRGGSAKYQTCLIFHRSSRTLDPGLGSTHLVTILSCGSVACWTHFPTVLSGSPQVFDCRVGNIPAGKAGNTPQRAIKRN